MRNRLILIVTMYFLVQTQLIAQQITGLWEAINVNVGEENMTPVAKWIRLNKDGSFESGNGWLQNSKGRYDYDPKESTFSSTDPRGIKDEFGAFKISIEKDKMFWEREEEGMTVIVTWNKIQSLPEAPADLAIGMWKLKNYLVDEEDRIASKDPNGKGHIFIRWDREFRQWDFEGKRSSGLWHINGHRSLITFLPRDEEKAANSWMLVVDNESLILKGTSDENSNTEMRFERVKEFPR